MLVTDVICTCTPYYQPTWLYIFFFSKGCYFTYIVSL